MIFLAMRISPVHHHCNRVGNFDMGLDMSLLTLGDRAFVAAAPREWNALPKHLRTIKDFGVFKIQMKTSIFNSICQPKLTL